MALLRLTDLQDLNRTFEERTPQELLQWAKSMFGDRVTALSSMQRSGNVVCHMLYQNQISMPVLFVDTGVLFPETYRTRDKLIEDYNLTVHTLHPEQTMEEQTAEKGILYLSVEGQQECCHLRKVEPLRKMKGQYDAMIGSLRRSDGGRRESCPILSLDPELNCVRINPLATFTDEQMKQYIEEHNVYINPLHAQGYATIGCNRCTTPIMPNEPKRAGRWRHLGGWAAYCGINFTDLDPDTTPRIELEQDLIDRILGRETDFMI